MGQKLEDEHGGYYPEKPEGREVYQKGQVGLAHTLERARKDAGIRHLRLRQGNYNQIIDRIVYNLRVSRKDKGKMSGEKEKKKTHKAHYKGGSVGADPYAIIKTSEILCPVVLTGEGSGGYHHAKAYHKG